MDNQWKTYNPNLCPLAKELKRKTKWWMVFGSKTDNSTEDKHYHLQNGQQ